MKSTWPVLFGLLLLAAAASVQAQFDYTTNADGISITHYSGPPWDVTIPTNINGLTVTSIGEQAFEFCTNLTSVTISDSVTNIGEYAFSGCTNLADVYFQGNAPIADPTAFDSDTNATVYYPPCTTGWSSPFDGLPAVEATAEDQFDYTTNDGAITITITGYTGSCGTVIIPTNINGLTVTSIGEWAFYNCASLTSVTIPGSVTSIGFDVFFLCVSLTAITVDAQNSFYSSLNGVLFDKSQTTLIQYPGGLAGNYTIPSSVTSIGNRAFGSCYGLTSVMIPGSVTSFGSWTFAYCTKLTNVIIANGVTSIGGNAFFFCTNLASVTIPDSVTSIGFEAFLQCYGLTNVTIPGSVASFDDYAFMSCYNLTSVYFLGNAPASGYSMFAGDPTTVYYLPGTSGWSSTFGGVPTMELTAITITANPTNGVVPLTVSFTSAGVDSVGNAITNWNWTFGDGSTSIAKNPSHTYTTTRTFSVALIATNNNGVPIAGAGASITVSPLTVAFTANPTNGVFPLTVSFASAGVDNGGNTISNWNWSFGDGSTSTAQNPSHTYTTNGTFSPALIATNSIGYTVIGTGASITVSPLTVAFTANPTNGVVPLTVSFTSAGVDNGGNAITNWNWSFGDGSTSIAKNPSHTYTTTGTFSVALIATNNIGWTVTGSGPASIIAAVYSGLVLNGCFETGDFTGWTLSGDTSWTFVDDGSQSGITPYSGNYEAALGASGSLGYLSQTLATTAGAPYSLSLWLSSLDDETPNEFLVFWNGNTLFDETNIPAIGWTNLQFLVTATGPSTVLEFGERDDQSVLWLDDISVVPTQPGFASFGVLSNQFGFNINWTSGRVIVVEACTNLASPVWTPLQTNTLTNGLFYFSDPQWTNYPGRYYRIRSP